jgi:hypothetical protein
VSSSEATNAIPARTSWISRAAGPQPWPAVQAPPPFEGHRRAATSGTQQSARNGSDSVRVPAAADGFLQRGPQVRRQPVHGRACTWPAVCAQLDRKVNCCFAIDLRGWRSALTRGKHAGRIVCPGDRGTRRTAIDVARPGVGR